MYIPLHLCPSGRRNATKRIYEYQMISNDSAKIRVTTDKDTAEALIDLETLERMKNEIFQLYIFRNSVNKPYLMASIQGAKIMLSRYILRLINSPLVVDHINGDTLDNRSVNLKAVTQQDNLRNRKQSKNKYGLRGVHPAGGAYKKKGMEKYQANINLGTFDTPEEAHKVYKEAYEKLFPGMMHKDKW